MRISNNPATAELQRTALKSRRDWMEAARIYSYLFPTPRSRASKRDCIELARRASRSARELIRYEPEPRDLFESASRCSCGTEFAILNGNRNPGGLDDFCPIHGQDIR